MDVAIIGISSKFPDAGNAIEFWDNLVHGRNSVKDISDERYNDLKSIFKDKELLARAGYLKDISSFDYKYFKIPKGEAIRMDPAQRLLLTMSVEALNNAGYSIDNVKGSDTGVFLSSYTSHYQKLLNEDSHFDISGISPAMSVTRISRFFDFKGPALMIDTSCSSVLVALKSAIQNIELKECSMALVGGITLSVPTKEAYAASPIISSDSICRAFDINSNGTVGGEGGGLIVIKSLEHALANNDYIYAIIKNVSVNHCGATSQSITAPSPESQKQMLLKSWSAAKIDPKNISAIECHGTGTVLGDPIEFKALTDAFTEANVEKQSVWISSVKTNIGHLGCAAGIAGLIKGIYQLNKKQLVPNINYTAPNISIDASNGPLKILDKHIWLEDQKHPRLLGVTSLGLTGTNAHVLLEEVGYSNRLNKSVKGVFVKINANSKEIFENLKSYLLVKLKDESIDFSGLVKTINNSLPYSDFGKVIFATDRKNLIEKLFHTTGHKVNISNKKNNLLLPADYILNENIVKDFRSDYSRYNEIYNQIESILGQQVNENQLKLVHLYILAKILNESMIFDQIISGGIGNLIANALTKDTKEFVKILTLNNEISAFNIDKFNDYLDNAIKDSDKSFIMPVISEELKELLEGEKFKNSIHLYILPNKINDWSEELEEIFLSSEKSFKLNVFSGVESAITIPLDLPIWDMEKCWPLFDIKSTENSTTELSQEIINLDNINSLELMKRVWMEVLMINKVEDNDNFFELGGTSISGLEVVNKIHKYTGIWVDYDDIFEFSTAALFAKVLEKRMNSAAVIVSDTVTENSGDGYNAYIPGIANECKHGKTPPDLYDVELEREKAYNLKMKSIDEWVPEFYKPEKILLMGVTGFLGIHLLAELVKSTEAKICCIIRAENEIAAEQRLILKIRNFLSPDILDLVGKRIIAIAGNLEAEGLDLSTESMEKLIGLDTIYNAVAKVVHHGIYKESEIASLDGTHHLCKLAQKMKVKYYNHTSTLAVCGVGIPDNKIMSLFETELDKGQKFDKSPYAITKFKTEQYLNDFMQSNPDIDVKIFRIGFITGDSITGKFQENIGDNIIYQLIQSLNVVKILPDNFITYTQEMQPVDYVTTNFVSLSLLKNKLYHTFQLFNPHLFNFGEIATIMNERGMSIEINSFDKLVDEYKMIKNDVTKSDKILAFKIIEFSEYKPYSIFKFYGGLTNGMLKKSNGFSWDNFNKQEYLSKFIDHCIERKFLCTPVSII